jgi:hypothetical protein
MKPKDHDIAMIAICIGKHWPVNFVPENELTQAVNEFLKLPYPVTFLELVRDKQLILHVSTREIKIRTGCWLSFSLPSEEETV